MSNTAVVALLQATDTRQKIMRRSQRKSARAEQPSTPRNDHEVAGRRGTRSTRNRVRELELRFQTTRQQLTFQDAIYSAKVHPMDVVTRPQNAQRYLRSSQGSVQTANLQKHSTVASEYPSNASSPSGSAGRASVPASAGTRRSPRQTNQVKYGAYDQKFHPMDSTLRPIRTAKSSALRNRDNDRPTALPRRTPERASPSEHDSGARRNIEAESRNDDMVVLTRSPGGASEHGTGEGPLNPSSRSISTRTSPLAEGYPTWDGSPDPRPSTPDICSMPRLQMSIVVPARSPSVHSRARSPVHGLAFSIEEHDQDCAMPDLQDVFDYQQYSADHDKRGHHASVQQAVDTSMPAESAEDYSDASEDDGYDGDTLVVREYVTPADNPWIQAPKPTYRSMTALDRRLYKLQHRQNNDEKYRDSQVVLPLSWEEVVTRLVEHEKLLSRTDFRRWGGMPALKARYEILQMILQGLEGKQD